MLKTNVQKGPIYKLALEVFLPRISIVMSTYNRARLIRNAIESVLAQDMNDWELIIVDDGSTDTTPQVVGSFESTKVAYYSKKNSGQPDSLNLGIRSSKSELVCFLDSDDTLESNHLSSFVSAFTPELDFVLGGFNLINHLSNEEPVVRDFYNPSETISLSEVEVLTGVICVRTDKVKKIGGFRNVPSTDTDLVTRMRASGYRWINTEKRTYNYHFGISPDSVAIMEREREKRKGNK